VCGLIVKGVEDDGWMGAYNCTAPNPVRMGELCSALGDVMSRPSFVPVPDFALNVLLGEGAQVVLEGQRVLPTKALEDGYEFKYAKVGDALRNLISK
jgi:NAD dependent epimerase/dehydratase family enzyme